MKNGTTRHATGTSCPVKEPRGHARASGERHRLRAGDIHASNDAVAPAVAVLLIVALTVVLAALLLPAVLGLISIPQFESVPPEIFKIVSISHTDEKGKIVYAGVISLENTGGIFQYNLCRDLFNSYPPEVEARISADDFSIKNKNYGAYLYVNGEKKHVYIKTLNGYDFIHTPPYNSHYNVAGLGGPGCRGDTWKVGEEVVLDIENQIIFPGNVIRIDIYNTTTGEIISRSSMTAPEIVKPIDDK